MTWTDDLDAAVGAVEQHENGTTAAAAMTEAGRLLGVRDDDPLVRVYRENDHLDAPLTAWTASGTTIRWDHQRDMLTPKGLIGPVLAKGHPGPKKLPPSPADTLQAYRHLVAACETFEAYDALEEAHGWIAAFLALDADGINVWEHDFRDRDAKFLGVHDMQTCRWKVDEGLPPRLVDTSTGALYVRVQDVMDFLRSPRHKQSVPSYPELIARLGEIGWSHHELQCWESVPRREGARKAHFKAFRSELES